MSSSKRIIPPETGIVIELYSEKTLYIYTETYYSQRKGKYNLKYQ